MKMRNTARAISVLAVLIAGSCAAPDENSKPQLTQDPQTNHPITVAPSYHTLRIANTDSLSPDDAEKLSDFADSYLANGNGSVTIAAPPGPEAAKVVSVIGEELVSYGVPRSRILVGQQDRTTEDGQVEIGFIGYKAKTAPCGDWSVNAADTSDNLPMPNFGCAVQQNIAAQVADPRDLVQTRGNTPSDATRRMQVLNKYEQGQPTPSTKTQSQSAAVSDVGQSQ